MGAIIECKEFPNRSRPIIARDGWREVGEYTSLGGNKRCGARMEKRFQDRP